MEHVQAIVLAAGQGTRMKSERPKVLHEACGRSLISWTMQVAGAVTREKPIVVVGHGAEQIRSALGDAAQFCLQSERKGTGHAVMTAQPLLRDDNGYVLVMAGDMPLLTGESAQRVCREAIEGRYDAVLLSVVTEQKRAFGRIVRDEDGRFVEIVEEKDASEAVRAIRELNVSLYCFRIGALKEALSKLQNQNAQGEYYLTDVPGILAKGGGRVAVLPIASLEEAVGVNDRAQLAEAAAVLRGRIARRHMLSGVTIIDPAATYIDDTVVIEEDAVVYPGNVLQGQTVVKRGVVLYPNNRIVDAHIGEETVVQSSVILESSIGAYATIGPFAYVRPHCVVADHTRIGDFVELKNARIDEGAKVSHLTYVGDGHIGRETNIGCGVVFVNYDGDKKHYTEVGDNAFVGCNTNLVSPVNIGSGAYVAAGSTVTDDVPPDALCVARERQVIKEGWAARRREMLKGQ